MIIVLEGCSKTGKTTLAKYIVKKYKFGYIKCSQPKGDPYLEYMKILSMIARKGGHWVIDRFHIGELVWGPLYRGKSELSDEQFRNIELKMLALNPLIIYCYDFQINIADRFKKDNEEWELEDKIKEALKLYDSALKKSIINMTVNRMKSKHDLIRTRHIDIAIDCFIDDQKKNKYYKTIIGNVSDPLYIFVGDKRNTRVKKIYGQPFDFGPASRYLFNAIDKSNKKLKYIAILNSDSSELRRYFKEKFNCMHVPTVVALGNNASRMLEKIKIPHRKLTHPSYENRFHHHDDRFIKKLKSIM